MAKLVPMPFFSDVMPTGKQLYGICSAKIKKGNCFVLYFLNNFLIFFSNKVPIFIKYIFFFIFDVCCQSGGHRVKESGNANPIPGIRITGFLCFMLKGQ